MFLRKSLLALILISILFIGCATTNKPIPVETPKPAPIVEQKPVTQPEPPPTIKVAPEVLEEYAKIHQISDPKKAEFYLTHPDYAKENPYVPTATDIEFYERAFMEKIYPDFKKSAEKWGFSTARAMYMNNPPAGQGSFWIGSTKYGALMQGFANRAGQGASTGDSDALLNQDPATANYNEGMFLYKKGKVDEAIKRLETAIKIRPDSPAIQYNLGVMYMDKDNSSGAIQCFENAIINIKSTGYTKVNLRLYPDVFVGASTNLGMLYTRIGLYDRAIAVLSDAVQFKPEDADANRNLAIAYYAMGDLDKANEQMQKYIKIDPNSPEAYNNVGLIFYQKEDYEQALAHFKKAKELKPGDKQYIYNGGLALAKLGQNDDAAKAFKESSGFNEGETVRQTFIEEVEANKWRELYNQGHSAMEYGNTTLAIELFNEVLKIKPDMLEAHVNLGFCYRLKGDKEKQIYHFEQALKLSPDSADINFNLGLAYDDSKMYPQAIERFNKTIKLKSDYKDAYFNLGTTYYRQSKYTDSIKAFEKAVELSPNWLEARLNLGSSYLKVSDVKNATIQFEEATKRNPKSAEAYYNLGIAYMKDNRFNEAKSSFQKAVDTDPGHKMARAMLKEIEIYNENPKVKD
jgi:tetratricopeptide (TPR) repeat protein